MKASFLVLINNFLIVQVLFIEKQIIVNKEDSRSVVSDLDNNEDLTPVKKYVGVSKNNDSFRIFWYKNVRKNNFINHQFIDSIFDSSFRKKDIADVDNDSDTGIILIPVVLFILKMMVLVVLVR